MKQVSESLAGRASYLTLWPMTRGEQRGEARPSAWEALIAADDGDWLDLLRARPDITPDGEEATGAGVGLEESLVRRRNGARFDYRGRRSVRYGLP